MFVSNKMLRQLIIFLRNLFNKFFLIRVWKDDEKILYFIFIFFDHITIENSSFDAKDRL